MRWLPRRVHKSVTSIWYTIRKQPLYGSYPHKFDMVYSVIPLAKNNLFFLSTGKDLTPIRKFGANGSQPEATSQWRAGT